MVIWAGVAQVRVALVPADDAHIARLRLRKTPSANVAMNYL